jgi:hypothetical protein
MSSTATPLAKKAVLDSLVDSPRIKRIEDNQKQAYGMLCKAAEKNPPGTMRDYGQLYDDGVSYMNLAEMCSEDPKLANEYLTKADRLFYDVYACCRAYAVRK